MAVVSPTARVRERVRQAHDMKHRHLPRPRLGCCRQQPHGAAGLQKIRASAGGCGGMLARSRALRCKSRAMVTAMMRGSCLKYCPQLSGLGTLSWSAQPNSVIVSLFRRSRPRSGLVAVKMAHSASLVRNSSIRFCTNGSERPGHWRGQMRDLDDLIAVNRAPEVVLKDLLYGQVEVAFRKKRFVAEADTGSALDTPGMDSVRRRSSAQTQTGRHRSASSRVCGLRPRQRNASDQIAAPQRTLAIPIPCQTGGSSNACVR